MKEKIKNALFSSLNVLLVAAILIFILFGLAKIGLIDLPAFFAPLFGKDPNASSDLTDNGFSDILKRTENDSFTVLKGRSDAGKCAHRAFGVNAERNVCARP